MHAKSRTRLSDFTFTFHFHALEKEMATHSSILAWRIPGTEEPGGLPSTGLHRVRHDWSDLAAAAAGSYQKTYGFQKGQKVSSFFGFLCLIVILIGHLPLQSWARCCHFLCQPQTQTEISVREYEPSHKKRQNGQFNKSSTKARVCFWIGMADWERLTCWSTDAKSVCD